MSVTKEKSPKLQVVPSVFVKVPEDSCVFPFTSVMFDAVLDKLIDEIPASSSDMIVPSPLIIFILENFSSFASITPSLLESKSDRASKPDEAFVPSDFI